MERVEDGLGTVQRVGPATAGAQPRRESGCWREDGPGGSAWLSYPEGAALLDVCEVPRPADDRKRAVGPEAAQVAGGMLRSDQPAACDRGEDAISAALPSLSRPVRRGQEPRRVYRAR